ncbi:MAG: gliding motility-associated C-terminal protein [Bacteroidetes bacterium]|nr:gliding motility-associated C-terminal protein [Bacteroidota bacterium]
MALLQKICLCLTALMLSGPCHAQIVNGDFSNGAIGDCNAGGNWLTSPNPKEAEVSCHFDDVTNLCIDLTPCHDFGNGTWIEQRAATIPGQWYQLDMDLATLCGWDGSDAGVQVYIDGQKLCHRVFNDQFTCIPDSLNWKHKHSDYFEAIAAFTTIRIEGFSYCSGLNTTCPKGTIGSPGFIGLDNVQLVPVAMPSGSKRDTIIRICEQKVLDARPYAQLYDRYLWSTGATSDTIAIDTAGIYSVIIIDSCRVTMSDTIVYHVLSCDTVVPPDNSDTAQVLVVPNAFSPNGDGVNDIFRLRYKGAYTLSFFHVYNRWGQQVFSTQDMREGWDGRYKDLPQPTGVYQYYILYQDRNGKTISLTGNIELIR